MKKLLLLVILSVIFSIRNYAQLPVFGTNFDTASSFIHLDTVGNCWQIGHPSKLFFDSAYSAPNAIVTDTINNPSINSHCSFYFVINDALYPNWNYRFANLNFMYKIFSDTMNDGGYLDISYNGGMTWGNVVNDPLVYNNSNYYHDTLFDGNIGFSGNSGTWQQAWFYLAFCDLPFLDSVLIRFNYVSDSVQALGSEGWMIDDLSLTFGPCESVPELNAGYISSVAVPNPANEITEIKFSSSAGNAGRVVVTDATGKIIFELKEDVPGKIILQTKEWGRGIYFYHIITTKGKTASGKFIVD